MNRGQSALLTKFYRELQVWIDAGTKANGDFLPYSGICQNLWHFYSSQGVSFALMLKYEEELQQQFSKARLDSDYPFNSSPEHYEDEAHTLTIWKNPDRLEWVRKHAKL